MKRLILKLRGLFYVNVDINLTDHPIQSFISVLDESCYAPRNRIKPNNRVQLTDEIVLLRLPVNDQYVLKELTQDLNRRHRMQ